jgi:hypothetical protein
MQAAPVNEQHTAAPLLDRLLDETLGLADRRIGRQVVQVQFGLRHNPTTRERADQIVGHTKGRPGQSVAVLIHMQRLPWRPTLRRRCRRWRFRLPVGHSELAPRRQAPHPLHRSLEKPALFFLGRWPGASGWRWHVS